MEEKIDVTPGSSPVTNAEPISEDVKTHEKEAVPEEIAPKPAPHTIPYERFREVNERAKALEEENKKLKSSVPSEELAGKYPDWEFLSDEQKSFITRQEQLEKDVREIKEEKAWSKDFTDVSSKFSQIKGKEAEFKDFCYNDDNIGIKNLETLAKAFIFEEPVEPVPPRKGLEKPTGGPKQVPNTEMTLEDIKRLRETDQKLYIKMIRENRIKEIPEK